jgi:dipeptide/tripeptide permease
LVIIFEFFERGSYYGMMSVLAVYATDILGFTKEGTGDLLAFIQPVVYFMPIVAGALADRFGYRKALTVAFALLGGGYFLTSQMTSYGAVFLSLVVMGIGAGTFKPIISGTIARTTDETNSSIGFGIFYWTINLGAFLFPLIIVPTLKHNLGWHWILIASAIGTGMMIIPTLLFFREPTAQKKTKKAIKRDEKQKTGLFQTLANAFEIIYSPIVLLFTGARRSNASRVLCVLIVGGLLGYGLYGYLQPHAHELEVKRVPATLNGKALLVEIDRNQTKPKSFQLEAPEAKKATPSARKTPRLVIYKPKAARKDLEKIASELEKTLNIEDVSPDQVGDLVAKAKEKVMLRFRLVDRLSPSIKVKWNSPTSASVLVEGDETSKELVSRVRTKLRTEPVLAGISRYSVAKGLEAASYKPFFFLFVGIMFLGAIVILALKRGLSEMSANAKLGVSVVVAAVIIGGLWLIPSLSLMMRIITTVLSLTLMSLWLMDVSEPKRYKDHAKFLLMIGIYSGFWILYFQMFGSVLWYVKAYVNATPINEAVNSVLATFGLPSDWYFDIEHVTVINAGTIICLQLIISRLVKNTPAMPTMVAGILVGTAGMAILAISTHIWVFIAGIILFSVGEMTAHPKFISYVGLTAPRSRVAMYMGYLFLYGVIGSSIGSALGAKAYVHFVDHQNQPRVLWLLFACIGVATIVGLLAYNRFLGKDTSQRQDAEQEEAEEQETEKDGQGSDEQEAEQEEASGTS